MNCQVVQNKILALADPRLLPEAIRLHVASCAACQAWAQQAARLESLVEELPAPVAPASKKDALVAHLTRGEAIITRPPATPARPREIRLTAFLQRNALVIGGLAAAVLVALGVWAIVPRTGGTGHDIAMPDDPFLKKIMQRDLALARADTPVKRLNALSGMADDLAAQARVLSRVAGPDELGDLARYFDKVVTQGLVQQVEHKLQAGTLTPAEAKAQDEAINQVKRQLGETAEETEKMLPTVPPASKPALQKIVETARGGLKKLESTELRTK